MELCAIHPQGGKNCMASLSAIIQSRKKDLRQLNVLLRTVDSAVEKTQRKIKNLTSRKQKVPEANDLQALVSLISSIDTALNNVTNGIQSVTKAWYL
jgi:flagellar biosynthesis chaperone FliJ